MDALFTVRRGGLELPIVLSCEHAGAVIPAEYGDLGLTAEVLQTCPDVYDRGAAEIFEGLAERLDCHGIESRLCRLVIDLNRYLEQETLIPTRCGEVTIPANQRVSPVERDRRIHRHYLPYQRELVHLLRECEERHGRAYLFAIHTMAEDHFGSHRDMDFALACNAGCRVADSLAEHLAGAGYSVRMNDPFCLLRDVLRVPVGTDEERFNAAAVLVETNDRHCCQEAAVEVLVAAIRGVVGKLVSA